MPARRSETLTSSESLALPFEIPVSPDLALPALLLLPPPFPLPLLLSPRARPTRGPIAVMLMTLYLSVVGRKGLSRPATVLSAVRV